MRRPEVRLSLIYALLLLVLAYVGTSNQQLLRRHARLTDKLEAMTVTVGELRSASATITSPEAVATWAVRHGMIPITEGTSIAHLPPTHPPEFETPATGLEMRTLWR